MVLGTNRKEDLVVIKFVNNKQMTEKLMMQQIALPSDRTDLR